MSVSQQAFYHTMQLVGRAVPFGIPDAFIEEQAQLHQISWEQAQALTRKAEEDTATSLIYVLTDVTTTPVIWGVYTTPARAAAAKQQHPKPSSFRIQVWEPNNGKRRVDLERLDAAN